MENFSKKIILIIISNILINLGLTQTNFSISNLQFNDTELYWVNNATIFHQFTNHFESTVRTTFEGKYCEELQIAYLGNNYTNIISIFKPIINIILANQCNGEKCSMWSLWNTTNQNEITSDVIYKIAANSIILFFPLFLMIIMILVLFSFGNCLYFNYCYCWCYDLDSEKKSPKYFNKAFVFITIFTTSYISGAIFLESRFQKLETYAKYTLCQIVNNNVYQIITGINITDQNNKDQTDPDIDWKGLTYLNETFVNYVKDLKSFQNNLLNQPYFSSTDPIDVLYNDLKSGIQEFKNFTSNNNFAVIDPNGQVDYDFNITWICNNCKNLSLIDSAYQEINLTLYKWQRDMNDLRRSLYNEFINTSGWNTQLQKQNDTYTKMQITAYKTYKFYNKTQSSYDSIISTFNIFKNLDLTCFISNTISCILGLVGYILVRRSIDKINHRTEISNYKGAAERDILKVKHRWTFHLNINSNMITAVIISTYSLIFTFFAVFLFMASTVIENNFKGQMKNFSYIPNGDLIDLCTINQTVNDYFNFTQLNNYLINKKNIVENLKKNYTADKRAYLSQFELFKKSIDQLSVADFKSMNNPNIPWDINGDQINYFLYPLNSYQNFKNPAKEVLQQYTDYQFSPIDKTYINKQKSFCNTKETSRDIWVDDSEKCMTKFNAQPEISINIIKLAVPTCYPLNSNLTQSVQCGANTDWTIPNCYIQNYIKRYSSDSDFSISKCIVPNEELSKTFTINSNEYFISKIKSLLTKAVYEYLIQVNMTSQIRNYQDTTKNLIFSRFTAYQKGLNDAYNYYITLSDNFEILRKWFKINLDDTNLTVIDKTGMMKNSNCSFISSNKRVFYFMRDLIANELFGLSITYIGLVIVMFINSSIVVLTFLKLRTDKELSEIRNHIITIKSIEDKEKRYFFAANNFIETDDAKMMEIDIENSTKKNKKKDKNKADNISKISNREEKKEKSNNFSKIDEFVKNEENEFDLRMKMDNSSNAIN